MPRIKPTTTFTPRVKPTNEYTRPRWEICITWDQVTTTWDSETRTWDEMCWVLQTQYSTPRYWLFVEDLTWANVFDLAWESVQWISGNRTNKIDTIYT